MSLNIGNLPMVRLFVQDTVHYQLDASSDDEWSALAPGEGLIDIHGDGKQYSIALFHQLRCLNLIRVDLGHIQAGGDAVSPSPIRRHCFNYLRQSALCHSDLNLDSVTEDNDVRGLHTYACRDWSMVYEAVAHVQGA
ncbi:hypothetical protein OF83DRAFT_706438 [Amylostereum chailletii]|nr:hypothetical protein OF83DRAFT_706438 [Amylostereum chailletii]